MASQGRAPKPPEQRRNRALPRAGEWIDLPATLDTPVLPPYGGGMTIPRYFYAFWRDDPITTQYNAADMAAAMYLAREWALMAHPERRMMMDRLGLSPKARRDLRWRTQLEAEQQRQATAKVRKLRVVGEPTVE
jgi:hypothetical protein